MRRTGLTRSELVLHVIVSSLDIHMSLNEGPASVRVDLKDTLEGQKNTWAIRDRSYVVECDYEVVLGAMCLSCSCQLF